MTTLGNARFVPAGQPQQIGGTVTDDGLTVSVLFEGFEVRLAAGSGGSVAGAVAQLSYPVTEGADGGSLQLRFSARFGGVLPAGAEVQISIISAHQIAQKLLTAEDLEQVGPIWEGTVTAPSDFAELPLVLLLTAARKGEEELLFQWDSLDVLVGNAGNST